MVSCSKDEVLNETEVLEKSTFKVDLNNVTSQFKNEYAFFKSDEELRAFSMQYNDLDDNTKTAILGKLNYQTLVAHIDEIYEGMISIETRETFVDYVDNYSGLMEIVTSIDGEEEVEEKEISQHVVAPFLNTDRIIQVGNEFRKYIGGYYVAAEDYNILKDINTTKDIYKSGLDYQEVITIESGVTQKVFSFSDEIVRNERWCKNDRKAELNVFFKVMSFKITGGSVSTTEYDVVPSAEATAKRKGVPCIWYKYKNPIEWKDFHIEYEIDGAGIQTWQLPNTTLYRKTIYRNDGSQFFGSPKPSMDFKKIKSKIGTRGIGAQFLTVDRNF